MWNYTFQRFPYFAKVFPQIKKQNQSLASDQQYVGGADVDLRRLSSPYLAAAVTQMTEVMMENKLELELHEVF